MALLFALCMLFAAAWSVDAAQPLQPLPVWPAPRGPVTLGDASVLVSPALSVSGAAQWPDVAAGVARFLERAFPRPASGGGGGAAMISSLSLSVANGSAQLAHGVDESYSLRVPADASAPLQLSAATQFGALAGLETLSQLLAFDADEATIIAIENAAHARGVPLKTIRDSQTGGREAYEARLVLVRPDHFVVWAGDSAPDADALVAKAAGQI